MRFLMQPRCCKAEEREEFIFPTGERAAECAAAHTTRDAEGGAGELAAFIVEF